MIAPSAKLSCGHESAKQNTASRAARHDHAPPPGPARHRFTKVPPADATFPAGQPGRDRPPWNRSRRRQAHGQHTCRRKRQSHVTTRTVPPPKFRGNPTPPRPINFLAGGGNVRGRGDVDLDDAAGPGAVPSAGPLGSAGMWTGTGLRCPCRAAQRWQAKVARTGGRPPAASAGSACRRAVSLVPVSAARCLMSAGCGWPVAARSSQAAARAANHGGRPPVMAQASRWLAAATRAR